MSIDKFFAFMEERHKIWLRRSSGQPFPWTDDPVLRAWRFCNVFRELDNGTIWIRRRNCEAGVPDFKDRVFNAFLYRCFNFVPTFEESGIVGHTETGGEGWRQVRTKILERSHRHGEKVFTSAHMMVGFPGESKTVSFLATLDRVFDWLQEIPFRFHTLEDVFTEIRTRRFPGIGPFVGYEIVSDLRFEPGVWVEDGQPTDTMTWANVGPGARRGLLRCGLKPTLDSMRFLLGHAEGYLSRSLAVHHPVWCRLHDCPPEFPLFELREIEHTLCEFDKYERTISGEGHPKERFV